MPAATKPAETLLTTRDRTGLIANAARSSVEAGEGLFGKAYLCDVARRVGVSVPDLVSNVETSLGDFQLTRGDVGSSYAEADKIAASRAFQWGEDVYFLDVA